MEEKDTIERYAMKKNILRKVLIRVDYDGVSNIGDWVDQFCKTPELAEKFGAMARGEQNQATFDLSRTSEIAKQRSIPLTTFKSELITKFTNAHFEGHEDRIEMEISSLYMTFMIDCVNYLNMDDYISYIATYFEHFLKSNRFYRIRRIGIRKIGGKRFTTLADVNTIFEPSLFACSVEGLEDTRLFEKTYIDRFQKDNVKVNFARRCKNTGIGEEPFEALLDLDGYMDTSTLSNYGQDLSGKMKQMLTDINNYLFHLFKMAVTIEHLRTYGR